MEIHARRLIGRVGLWSPELRITERTAEWGAELGEQGWKTFWLPGGAGARSIWDDAESLLISAPSSTVAFGVMSIWSADADRASTSRRGLVNRHGDRILVGLGAGSPASAQARGLKYTSALHDMRRYVDGLDSDPDGIPVGRRLIGTFAPKMTEFAAAHSAGVHTFLTTPEGTARSRALVGDGPVVAPYLPVSLETDAARARGAIRRYVGMFLRFPTYQNNLLRQGFAPEDFSTGGSDRLIDAISARGGIDGVTQRIREYLDAGADHVALHFLAADGSLPGQQWREAGPLASLY